MGYKKLIAYINSENEYGTNIVKAAKRYSDQGADEFYIYNYTKDRESRDEFFGIIKEIRQKIDIPFMVGLYVDSFEDVERAFLAGAERIVVKDEFAAENKEVVDEAIRQFGRDKILLEIDSKGDFANWELTITLKENGFAGIVLKHIEVSGKLIDNIKKSPLPVIIRDSLIRNVLKEIIVFENVEGVATNYFRYKNFMKAKMYLKEEGIPVNILEKHVSFKDLKTDSNGVIPVVVQDDRTGEVLIVYYMNEEAYEQTIKTGEMYYFNKETQAVWHKGEKSGNYHYVKHLLIDNDNDTILAKVTPAGKGRSCFSTELLKKPYDSRES